MCSSDLIDDFRVFDRAVSRLEFRELFQPGSLGEIVAARKDRDLIGEYVAAACDETTAASRAALETARRARDERAEKPLEVMVMRELPQPKTAYVLTRGDYDKRAAAVEPGTPAVLPPFPADQPKNRLGLARWLTDPEHPLLARVTVNRVWQ